ncbi:MAG TPA: sensor histidine kinase [Chloroflexota bacterium]|jgi:two-component system sensor histidine kinase UhpB|nr:sensor histidine kinase [Chloroflexota bacterium]
MEAIEGAKPVVHSLDTERRVILWLRAFGQRLLSVPIFYKVLLANSLIVVLGAVAGTWLTIQYLAVTPDHASGELILLFAGVGITLSVLVNFVVLKAAFQPLASLERAVEAVRHGNMQARAAHVAFSDPQIDQLVDTINSMLDGLETYRERVRLLSQQVLTAQEAERQRIARELHDETAQSLTSLLIGLRMIEKASTPEELSAHINDLRNQTGRTLQEVRKMAVDLRPSTLDDLGLAAALQWYTDSFARQTHIAIDLRLSGLEQRLPDAVEVVVYRIVQEALTNVAKHANASHVAVSIFREGNCVRANVVDNGQGFDVERVMRSRERGLGLFGMQERVSLVGGTLRIASSPGQSTRVSISIPLES